MNVIVYAIPVFLALMAAEFGIGLALGRNVYRLNDAVGSLTAGILSQISSVFTAALSVGVYVLVYNRFALFSLEANDWRVWVGALIAYDFFYYWNHRIDHEVGIFWAAHVVHHQSEAFNLSTALRQPSSAVLLGWIFYLPMAIAGVPPLVFVAVGLIDLLYQFWIHTELVGKLGWFDRVFASPSNHRVHHGVNDKYLDKNYGGILILWDRLFGTYEDEVEAPVFGVARSTGCCLRRSGRASCNSNDSCDGFRELNADNDLDACGFQLDFGWSSPKDQSAPKRKGKSSCDTMSI